MYLEHYHLKQSPFSEQPDTAVFFPGGQRAAILEQMLADLEHDAILVHLNGDEGSGKTLLCQMVRERLQTAREVVLLSEPAGAFDDMGRVLALALGVQDAQQLAGPALYDSLLQQLHERALSGRPALLIIDDAEKLFLAALERILRLSCDAQAQGGFQLLLAGRPALLTNLDQIASTCDETLRQTSYTLPPLDQADTARYLAFRLEAAGMPDARQDSVFSAEAISKMHEATSGNIRLINILAEESLRNSCEGKSFMVLLDHVTISSELTPAERISISRPAARRNSSRFRLTALVTCACLAGAALLLIFGGKSNTPSPPAVSKPVAPPPGQPVAPPQPPPPVTEPSPPPLAVSTAPAPPAEGHLTAPPPPAPPASPAAAMEPLDTPAPRGGPVHSQTQGAPPPSQPAPPVSGIISIAPMQEKKPAAKPAPAAVPAQPKESTAKKIDGGKLFDERERAARNWVAGGLRGKYTIQLMVATTAGAETSVRSALNGDDYQRARGQLYILRNKGNTPGIFLFHGIYASMEEARQARKQLPPSLQKYNPYPLAIADALRKAGQ